MGNGYTRNDSANNIADGNVINASDLDGEFDAIQGAFNGTSGHSHDGTSGEGPAIAAGGIASNAVTTAKILDANVTTAKIADGNVTTAKIAADAITGDKIADDTINSEHYAADSIDNEHLANDAVGADELASNAVVTASIVDANVTLAKIANQAANTVLVRDANSSGVVSAKALATTEILIGDGTGFTAASLSGDVTMANTGAVTIGAQKVLNSMLADDAVGADELAANAVVTASIVDDNVTQAKIADDAVGADQLASSAVVTASIVDANVTTAKIADANVTTAKIADANVTTAKIADLNVTTGKIAADAITGAKIADDAIDSEHYADGSIDTAHIANLQITTALIAADAVTTAKIADDVELGGNPTTTTQSAGNNTTRIATTAFVSTAVGNAEPFPQGTSMLFQQTSAPTGWTKQTTHNDKALRLQTGTVGTGGSVAFSTAMATPAVAGGSVSGDPGSNLAVGAGNLAVSMSGNISNTTLSINQIPSHTHGAFTSTNFPNSSGFFFNSSSAGRTVNNAGLGNAGGGGAHNHGHNLSGSMSGAPSLSGNVTAGNLAVGASTATINVQYVDFIIANKD